MNLRFLELDDEEFKQKMKKTTWEKDNMLWDLRNAFREVLNRTYKDMKKKRQGLAYKIGLKQKYGLNVENIKI